MKHGINTELQPAFLIRSAKICKWLFVVSASIFILNLGIIYLKFMLRTDNFFINTLFFFFDASRESTIPTAFSIILLFTSAIVISIIYAISARGDKLRKYWLVLGCIFFGLTIDEAAVVHEQFNRLRPLVNDQSGFLYYTWIIPYAVLALLAGAFFIRFLQMIGLRTRKIFLLSGTIYVGAALGMELIEGYYASRYGVGNLTDKLLCNTEEFLEMTGVIIFLYGLLDYLSALKQKITVSVH